MISMDYTAHLTFNDFGYAETLTLCDVSTRGTDTMSIYDRIPPHLKSKENLKFGVEHVLIRFYRNRIRNNMDNNKKNKKNLGDPRIGTVDKKTFYLLRGIWPNVTLLPSENVDGLRKEMIANVAAAAVVVKDHGLSIVHITFDAIHEDLPSTLYVFNTKEPYEVTHLDLRSSDEPIYEALNMKGGGRRYEVRHRILDFYEENDWNNNNDVGTRDAKTFEYLRKTWPRISFLGQQFDIGKAMVELTAEKYRPENLD